MKIMKFDQQKYVNIFTEPLFECLSYMPKFGNSQNKKGVSLNEFMEIYGNDPFYSKIGLNSPFMYAAHKASGGMTSIYRQIGIGCERLFRQIVMDATEYSDYSFTQWGYKTKTKSGKDKILSLDGRLELSAIENSEVRASAFNWIQRYCEILEVDSDNIKGAVFEVRQGYKSKDSKRQNGDLDNATVAYAYHYLPIFTVFSSQIDNDIVLRYTNNRCGIITGSLTGDEFSSLYCFMKEVLGFDLLKFFEDNSNEIQKVVTDVLKTLLNLHETAL